MKRASEGLFGCDWKPCKQSQEMKEIILLRYYGDLTVKDTAELLSIPQGTVATRTKKALSLLKEDLTKEEGGSLDR